MVKKNYTSWLIMLLISAVLLSLMACGSKKGPKNAEEASAMHKDLMAQENAILSKNTQLWDKVFMAAAKITEIFCLKRLNPPKNSLLQMS